MFSLNTKEFAKKTLYMPECIDSISVATQLGRLDFISALLAVLGILIAIVSIYAFFNFRAVARKQASEEAKTIAAEIAEKTVNEYLQDEMPKIIDEYRSLLFGDHDEADEANEIALAQE